jgi:ssDNA-binding Zn-finger/Zn-ribbon topoisomerase 1
LIPFLNKAIIIADFHICGNLPVCREQLKIISLVKKLMGKSTSSPIPPLQNEVTGEFVVNDEDKANLLIPFLNKAIIIVDFHICGNLPVCREQLKIISRAYVNQPRHLYHLCRTRLLVSLL